MKLTPEYIEKAAYLVLSEMQNLENKPIKYIPSVIIKVHYQFCHVIKYALLSKFQKYIKQKVIRSVVNLRLDQLEFTFSENV